MRLIALLALSFMTLAAAPTYRAEAATTRQQQASTRPAANAPAAQARRPAAQAQRPAARRSDARATTQRATTQRATTQRATTQRAASAPAARNRAAPSRNRAVSSACERRDSRGRCVGPRTASWQGGLPTASNIQSDCPPGTMATLARGHSSVTRCMPL